MSEHFSRFFAEDIRLARRRGWEFSCLGHRDDNGKKTLGSGFIAGLSQSSMAHIGGSLPSKKSDYCTL